LTDVYRLQVMFPHSPLRTGHATFTAPGSLEIGDFPHLLGHWLPIHQSRQFYWRHLDFTKCSLTIVSTKRQSPGPLRHVDGFPVLRLLWSLRLLNQALVDVSPLHPDSGLPRSQDWTLRHGLGSGYSKPNRSLRLPIGDRINQVTHLVL
jgi:hypothetical protein